MFAGTRLSVAGVCLILSVGLAGCESVTGFLNPDFLAVLGVGEQVSSLPGDAPGLLVTIENRTSLWIRVVVSYRDVDSNVQNYTTVVGPDDKTARMLVCPVEEITLGSVSDLEASGAIVYVTEGVGADADFESLPFIEVDAFGVLLREDVNYSCGDGLTFSVRATPGQTRSGYRTRVEVDYAGAP